MPTFFYQCPTCRKPHCQQTSQAKVNCCYNAELPPILIEATDYELTDQEGLLYHYLFRCLKCGVASVATELDSPLCCVGPMALLSPLRYKHKRNPFLGV